MAAKFADHPQDRLCPLPWSECEPWTLGRRDVPTGGALTEVRGNQGAGVVACGAPVMRMAYRVTMRATTCRSRLRGWLRPECWCRTDSGRWRVA